MSAKNNIKDRIKKASATQTFFNQYETAEEESKDSPHNEVDDTTEKQSPKKENVKELPETKEEQSVTILDVDNLDSLTLRDDDSYLRRLALGQKPKKKKSKKVFTSFYMDAELAEVVDNIVKNGEKGDKSKLINTSIRKLLKDYGVL